jgi:hypothetical protein
MRGGLVGWFGRGGKLLSEGSPGWAGPKKGPTRSPSSLSDLSLSRNYPKVMRHRPQLYYKSGRAVDIIFRKIPIFA